MMRAARQPPSTSSVLGVAKVVHAAVWAEVSRNLLRGPPGPV